MFRLLNFDPWVLHASMQQRQRLKNLDRSVKIIKPFNMKFLQDLILAVFEGKNDLQKKTPMYKLNTTQKFTCFSQVAIIGLRFL